MQASETVVVGLDTTPGSESALRWATDVARTRRWAVHLVHGLPAPVGGGDDEEAANRAAAERVLEAAAASAREAEVRDVRWTVVARPAGPVLIEMSEGAELLVVGARAGGARLTRSGDSVVAHVSRYARCPVVVVPREPRPRTGLVAVGLRGDAGDRPSLEFAFGQAAATRSEVEVVHAWLRPEDDRRRRLVEALVTEQVNSTAARYPDVAVRTVRVPADPRDAVRWSSADADLLVVGAPDPAVERSSADLVELTALRHARCPVVFAR